jgi:hypothetical protein
MSRTRSKRENIVGSDDMTPDATQAALREGWVTETALTTALYTSYFAENVALFAIIVGIVMLLVGIGFVVLTVFSRRGAAAGTPPPGAAT